MHVNKTLKPFWKKKIPRKYYQSGSFYTQKICIYAYYLYLAFQVIMRIIPFETSRVRWI
ncbi:hypothetical protein NHE_0513 [Neorickettsia helminthoeca str. Oregon]|uniref:Uncharacterized protein n=1 Tax=Neorickettsia helminthoeca str. Oregon TaxID=1286528 RepID=X5HK68_9RICK|nr:hypothetical protein NHE_0513 [Neorickettsia helminthoeca str. Oregon]